jgi:cytochrome c peroxidase
MIRPSAREGVTALRSREIERATRTGEAAGRPIALARFRARLHGPDGPGCGIRALVQQALPFLLPAAVGAQELPPPVTDDLFPPVDAAEVDLGRLLFWDPILSGNRNISCGTPRMASR